MMNIIFSTESIKYPLTGIGRYTLELSKRLAGSGQIEQLKFFHGHRFIEKLPDIEERKDLKSLAQHPLMARARKNPLVIEAWRYFRPRLQAAALRSYQDYIYHGPNFYLPHNIERAIATFHDISVFTRPQFHPADRVKFMEKSLKTSLDTARLILTVSEFSRQELINTLGYPPQRIIVTPLACSPVFYPRTPEQCQPVLEKYRLNWQGYGLYIGTMEPRKNIKGILQAYEQLPPKMRTRFPMIFSGYRGWEDPGVWRLVEQGTREGWVHYLGFVPESDLPFLYAAAATFIYPSFYEGFGLPVLEAMASGVPVVTSSTSSLPEVAGDAALMSEPQDIVALSRNIARSFDDPQWRQSAIPAGLGRAGMFSWDKCAEQTVSAYKLL